MDNMKAKCLLQLVVLFAERRVPLLRVTKYIHYFNILLRLIAFVSHESVHLLFSCCDYLFANAAAPLFPLAAPALQVQQSPREEALHFRR